MKRLGASDLFEVRKGGTFSSSSLLAMGELYLPLVGPSAFALYFALLGEGKKTSSHERLFQKVQLSPGDFYKAMLPLEAVGLVRTFYREEGAIHYFIYLLCPPLEPSSFLQDILFRGTLVKCLGEEAVKALEKKYLVEGEKGAEGFEEVSESFPSYFSPDLNDPVFGANSGVKSGKRKIDLGFDYREFASSFEGRGPKASTLAEGEIEKIARLSALYCLPSSTIGEFAADAYRGYEGKGKRIDFPSLEKACRDSLPFPYLHQEASSKSQISSDSIDANLLKAMDSLPPTKFLSYLQKGHKPASSDLKILNHLANDLGLADPAINVLLWFTLQRNDNELPYGYCDKVGASLIRQGCSNSRDAWEYLTSKKKKERKEPSFGTGKRKPSFLEESGDEGKKEQPSVGVEEAKAALAELFGEERK